MITTEIRLCTTQLQRSLLLPKTASIPFYFNSSFFRYAQGKLQPCPKTSKYYTNYSIQGGIPQVSPLGQMKNRRHLGDGDTQVIRGTLGSARVRAVVRVGPRSCRLRRVRLSCVTYLFTLKKNPSIRDVRNSCSKILPFLQEFQFFWASLYNSSSSFRRRKKEKVEKEVQRGTMSEIGGILAGISSF